MARTFQILKPYCRAFERWGVAVTLSKTVGMFAIVLWDVHQRTLHLARDRFGEKPLYYGWTGSGDASTFVFGSELKSLCAFPSFDKPSVQRGTCSVHAIYVCACAT